MASAPYIGPPMSHRFRAMSRLRRTGTATRATFAHPVGHSCADCADLRSFGPEQFDRNPWDALLSSQQFAQMASDAEAANQRYLQKRRIAKAKERTALINARRLPSAA